jgi:hypothetical protein
MRHHNSVFHAMLKHLPWDKFEALVEQHKADVGVRRLTTRSQLIALLYAQLAGASSLREIEAAMASHQARLYHVGAEAPKRSTLGDANALRPAELFEALFSTLLAQAHRGLRRAMAETTYLIDSTSLRLDQRASQWARYATNVCRAKLHVIYDADADQPVYAAVTAGKVNDITAAQEMPIEPGATYVFDLGYYDYAWWAELDAAGCRIVTRFKTNTPLALIEERLVPTASRPEDSTVLSDRVGFLPKRQMHSRNNPMGETAVREVRVKTETGKPLRIFSNDLDATAQEIADLYKRRWAIELFFRWIKQTLKITRFIGTTENAVRIQIAVALIAFLLLRLAQATQDAIKSPLAFARLVRTNLMHRRSIGDLLKPKISLPKNTNQACFTWP